MSGSSTEQLRSFLRDHVSSYEQLDVLLFMARAARRPWSASELAAALTQPLDDVTTALNELVSVGLLSCAHADEGRYHYVAAADLHSRILELAVRNEQHRLSVVQMMSQNALERIRRSAIRGIADAFGLGKTKK